MSFIVKGVDLPKDTEGISVTFYTMDGWRETHILDVTQTIQIPEGHGRLIDRDELQKAIKTDIMGGLNYEYFIRNAPIILEVEE